MELRLFWLEKFFLPFIQWRIVFFHYLKIKLDKLEKSKWSAKLTKRLVRWINRRDDLQDSILELDKTIDLQVKEAM